jgi:hypothetical protein
MFADDSIALDDSLESPNGIDRLRIERDAFGYGNYLVLEDFFITWQCCSWTSLIDDVYGGPGDHKDQWSLDYSFNAEAVMQGDGNFVLYGDSSTALWDTGTSESGAYLALQNDHNLVVYSSSHCALWALY